MSDSLPNDNSPQAAALGDPRGRMLLDRREPFEFTTNREPERVDRASMS